MIRYGWWIGMAVSAVLCGRFALHTFQLESYQLGGYFRAMKRVGARMFAPGLIAGGVTSAAVVLLTGESTPDWLMWLLLAAAVALSALLFLRQKSAPAKKPLVVTPRVKRLVGFWLAVSLCATALSPLMPLTLFLTPLWLALAALLALPVEKYIQYLYRRDAMKRLDAMPDLIKIGVTGSYGKTSAKFLLETILSEKYRVLVTPASFNTSMGVTRAIRERLAPEHQVFVAEMGSRHPGDIALLCKMVRPKYGILNSVGPQHLETFHTQEAILNEKFTLARAIPPDGAMVFGADGGLNDGLYEKADCKKHLAGSRAEGLGLTARDVEVGPWGSRFAMTDGVESVVCETPLLGAHNISNLLVACTLARVLGMDLPTIARGAAKAKPVEHRLQILPTAGGVTVIDDAFNANPVGASAALDVLAGFPGRRIIVTPGFVEMGAEEAKYNRALGEKIASCADIAVLIGKRHTAPIAEGIRAKGFPEDNLRAFASLDEATAWLGGVFRPGDVVLYENDLPDNYME